MGTDVNAKNNSGITPLDSAVAKGNYEFCWQFMAAANQAFNAEMHIAPMREIG